MKISDYKNSVELRKLMKERHGDVTVLSFSCGKDSLAAWIALREDGFEVHPFFMYMIPGLSFIDEMIGYYEKFFGVKIAQYPSPWLYSAIKRFTFQSPDRIDAIRGSDLPTFSRDDVAFAFREDRALPPDMFVGIGNRIADNMVRRQSFNRTGATNENRKTWWPVYDWLAQDVDTAFAKSGVKLSFEYVMFGRTFDGINGQYLGPIKRFFPNDYKRILEWFPLADLELYRYERKYS